MYLYVFLLKFQIFVFFSCQFGSKTSKCIKHIYIYIYITHKNIYAYMRAPFSGNTRPCCIILRSSIKVFEIYKQKSHMITERNVSDLFLCFTQFSILYLSEIPTIPTTIYEYTHIKA